MGRKSHRLRRWASLSALASAALAAGSGSGDAAIIYHMAHGIGPDAFLPLPGGNQIDVLKSRSRAGLSSETLRAGYGPKGNLKTFAELLQRTTVGTGALSVGGVSFRRKGGGIALANKGQTFKQVGSGAGSGLIGGYLYRQRQQINVVRYSYGPRLHHFPNWRAYSGYRPGYKSSCKSFRREVQGRAIADLHNGVGSVTFLRYSHYTRYDLVGYGKEYALFRFDVGPQTDYGWLELSLGNNPGSQPFVKLIGYAYDDTGQPIKAGAVPEPQHLPLAVGALAFGAFGLREWRKKRNVVS